MRPFLEKPTVPEGQSWAMLNRRLDEGIPFQWHYHREVELTLTLNSRGQRYVGDHAGAYGDGDLVLLGPNLPHTWASRERIDEGRPHVALVLWLRPDWLGALLASATELAGLAPMLARAGRGLRFSDAAAAAVRPGIERMVGLGPPARLVALLDVLVALSADTDAVPLTTPDRPQVLAAPGDRPRIERVLDALHARYTEPVRLDELAGLAHLSASGLHRLFRRHTSMSVLDYVAQLRIGRACQLLVSTDRPVAHIAEEAGYDNLSHFNRQFLARKGVTPREFRRGFPSGGRQGTPSSPTSRVASCTHPASAVDRLPSPDHP